MRTCRLCGATLPQKKCTDDQRRVAELNLKNLPKVLEEEGEFMTDYVYKSTKKIIYESHLALNNEYPWDDALCKSCRKKENKASKEFFGQKNNNNWIDTKALEKKSNLFQESMMIEQIIKKYLH